VDQIYDNAVNEAVTVTYQKIIFPAWLDGLAQDLVTKDKEKTEDFQVISALPRFSRIFLCDMFLT